MSKDRIEQKIGGYSDERLARAKNRVDVLLRRSFVPGVAHIVSQLRVMSTVDMVMHGEKGFAQEATPEDVARSLELGIGLRRTFGLLKLSFILMSEQERRSVAQNV